MYNKKLIGFFLIALILAVCIGTASASENTTLTSVNEEKTFTDIQTEIDNTCENDTIELEGTYTSQGNEIEVNNDLTFKGTNNTILDGKKSSRIINTDKNLVFEDITFQNALSYEYGGAIKSAGNLTFINCIFKDNNIKPMQNYYWYYGSAIYCEGKLTIVNCTFTGNLGDSVIQSDVIDLKNSKFINNPANNAVTGNRVTIDNCDFQKNSMAVYDAGTLKIKNSRFNKNKYGIYVYCYCELDVDNCNFTNNSKIAMYASCDSTVSNSRFENNRNGIRSYTPYISSEQTFPSDALTLKITNCTFKSNKDTAISTDGNLVVKKSTFKDNTGEMAGAIYSNDYHGYTTIRISDSTFTNNTAEYAGALKVVGAKVTIKNTTLKGNGKVSIILTSHIWGIYDYTYYSIAKLTVNSKTFKKSVNLNDNLKEMEVAKLTTNKVKTSYNSGVTLNIKIINKFTKKPVKECDVTLKVFTGKKYKIYTIRTKNNGIAKFSASGLNVGSHKIEITTDYGECKVKKTTTSATITKSKTIVKAPKVTNKYKKSEYFKITVKNKATKKPFKNTYIKVKIDKKTHKIKTNSKGIAKINTKNLKIGKHKVTITSANLKNYQMSAKSTITIKKITVTKKAVTKKTVNKLKELPMQLHFFPY